MACKCAKRTDEYHGWECEITEGPDAEYNDEEAGEIDDQQRKTNQ